MPKLSESSRRNDGIMQSQPKIIWLVFLLIVVVLCWVNIHKEMLMKLRLLPESAEPTETITPMHLTTTVLDEPYYEVSSLK